MRTQNVLDERPKRTKENMDKNTVATPPLTPTRVWRETTPDGGLAVNGETTFRLSLQVTDGLSAEEIEVVEETLRGIMDSIDKLVKLEFESIMTTVQESVSVKVRE